MHFFIFPLWIELTELSHLLAPNSGSPVHLATLQSRKCSGEAVLCGVYPLPYLLDHADWKEHHGAKDHTEK